MNPNGGHLPLLNQTPKNELGKILKWLLEIKK